MKASVNMAEIIRLSRDSASLDSQTIASADSTLPSVKEQPLAGTISTGSGVIPWVETLRVCLANLETVARGLAGPSREGLRREIRLLSAQLASAEDELSQNLRELRALRLDAKLNPVEQSGKSIRSREQVADHGADDSGVQRDSTICSRKDNLQHFPECSGIRP
jgi:hypothetical protein